MMTIESKRFRTNARRRLNMAIARWGIKRGPCEVCGAMEKIEAHHEDYSKPFVVRWLCRVHHAMVTAGKLCLLPRPGNKPIERIQRPLPASLGYLYKYFPDGSYKRVWPPEIPA